MPKLFSRKKSVTGRATAGQMRTTKPYRSGGGKLKSPVSKGVTSGALKRFKK